jgi:signal transduction histidine kinase
MTMRTFRLDKRISIAAKFNILTILVIVATSVSICLFMIRLEKKAYYNALLNHGKTIADTTAKNCELGIFTENSAALIPILQALASDTEIAYVSVMNRNGLALASQSFRGSGIPPEPAAAYGGNSIISYDIAEHAAGRNFLEILYPVREVPASDINDILFRDDHNHGTGAVIGYVRLGLTQEGLHRRLHDLIQSTVLFTSLLVLAGSTCAILWSRRITAPLTRLMAATQDVSEGKFDSPVDIRTTDEISDLARSFDHMRDRLKAYHCEVERRISIEQQHLREKEQLLMDLHDGIGGITTNICILAEVAQHAKDIDSVKQPLATISRLSREGISEIRSFMQSLDSKELTWQTLAAQLRIQGTTMVEPHRIRFNAETSVDEAQGRPGSLLWVNIFRIYKEALTNVIKHAQAKSVAVSLRVSEKTITLTVQDDGGGWSEAGQPGRGIPNMKKRAQEVGGAVTIHASSSGTTIALGIPLPFAYTPNAGEC